MNKESEKSDNKIYMVFVTVLLVIIILYLIIALTNPSLGLLGPMGPPGPVTTIPTVVLPFPVDTATKSLFDYKEPVTIIVPTANYPIIAAELPTLNECIIHIKVYAYKSQGTLDLIVYLYTVNHPRVGDNYERIRTVEKITGDVIRDTDWAPIRLYLETPERII